jgi:hypothetical protein
MKFDKSKLTDNILYSTIGESVGESLKLSPAFSSVTAAMTE